MFRLNLYILSICILSGCSASRTESQTASSHSGIDCSLTIDHLTVRYLMTPDDGQNLAKLVYITKVDLEPNQQLDDSLLSLAAEEIAGQNNLDPSLVTVSQEKNSLIVRVELEGAAAASYISDSSDILGINDAVNRLKSQGCHCMPAVIEESRNS